MDRTVLLRHDLPDGTWHYDWLLTPPPSPEPRGLICFRVWERIDSGQVAAFRAERLADHRLIYLDYEGPVSDGRGTVKRVVEGSMKVEVEGQWELVAAGELGETKGKWIGRRNGSEWEFRRVGMPRSHAG